MGGDKGAVAINENSTQARFLLLYNSESFLTSELLEFTPGFKVKGRSELEERGYTNAGREFYMVVENVEEVGISALRHRIWDVSQLKVFQEQRGTKLEGAPFLINLQELINIQTNTE